MKERGSNQTDFSDQIDLDYRFWEIDLLRGMAVVMMVCFHVIYDLNYFGLHEFYIHSGLWPSVARFIATFFLLLVGVSLHLSYSRNLLRGEVKFSKYLRRGLFIFFWGMVITLTTWLLVENFIVFGILHLIGVSVILVYPFLRFYWMALLQGGMLLYLDRFLDGYTFDYPWFLWLGLIPKNFHSLDYFPIIPWFGMIMVGLFLGRSLYPDYKRRLSFRAHSPPSSTKLICLLGKNSLLIYLAHQPLILCILYFLCTQDVGHIL